MARNRALIAVTMATGIIGLLTLTLSTSVHEVDPSPSTAEDNKRRKPESLQTDVARKTTPLVNTAAAAQQRIAAPTNNKFTVVLMSYPASTRHHLLVQIIAKCRSRAWQSLVHEVLLVWNGPLSALPATVAAAMATTTTEGSNGAADEEKPVVPARILPQEANRVDNRWRVGEQVGTDGVLNMDDDVDLSLVGAQCMHAVWSSSRHSLVAIDVRSHFRHFAKPGAAEEGEDFSDEGSAQLRYIDGPFGPYGYAARDSSEGFKRYSIALPRALLTSKEHYITYDAVWRNASSGLKLVVDELLCDDIAFNFAAANTNFQPQDSSFSSGPLVIYTKAKYATYKEGHGKDAMFNKPGMKAMRQKCVNRLAQVFRGMPLRHRRWHVLCDVDG